MTDASDQALSRNSYNVGCICPMGIELAPLRGMLDEIHDPLSLGRDQNAYILGKIGEHNVVVAAMPEIGNNTAAVVATQLLNDFPAIRFSFLVGIGGGIPGEDGADDVRLGDVVVSQPSGTSGGVVQYDFGKGLVHGGFTRLGQLNKPPAILNAHVQMLRAQHALEGSQIPKYLEEMATRFPRSKKQFSFPVKELDQLFLSSYDHRPGPRCASCDPTQTVTRNAREDSEPQIHYGIIGSANMVVKDPATRDKLKQDMNVLCVEMEAAGLISSFPCLVIRGICDYADSHKNKEWQPYAAATAAAYMKELLMTIPARRVMEVPVAEMVLVQDTGTHKLLNKSVEIQDRGVKIQQQVLSESYRQAERGELRFQNARERDCHQAFKTSSYEKHKDINPVQAPGTCRWVLNHPHFRKWNESIHTDLLWVSADPGCGKSVFSKFLIDCELNDDHSTICYFFFKDNKEQESLDSALCALLHQLFASQPRLIHHAISVWEKNGSKLQHEIKELWRILLSATTDSCAKPVICIFDALDECCDKDRSTLIGLMCDFYERSSLASANASLKFLVTSRPYDSVQRYFEPMISKLPQIHLRGEDENDAIHREINLVIDQRVRDLTAEFSLSVHGQALLRKKLLEMEHRTYLWLFLALEDIRNQLLNSFSPDTISVESLPVSVEDAYERVLQKIDKAQEPHARNVLLIVVGARRPLTIAEMASALAALRSQQLGISFVNPLNENHLKKQIRNWCGLFVFFKQDRVFLIHQTAKEYLLRETTNNNVPGRSWRSLLTREEIESEMGKLCVQFLCFAPVQARKVENNQEPSRLFPISHKQENASFKFDLKQDRFLVYVARYWAKHLTDDDIASDVLLAEKVMQLYNIESPRYHLWLSLLWSLPASPDGVPKMMAQHAASYNGHLTVLRRLRDVQAFDIEAQDSTGRTPLVRAAEQGHGRVVQWLIDLGANVHVTGPGFGSALQSASQKGHTNVAQMIITASGDWHHPGWLENALLDASYHGHEEVSRVLIKAGAKINLSFEPNHNPLYMASMRGHEKVVQLLLDEGSSAQANSKHITKPLEDALVYAYDKVAWILIDHDSNKNNREWVLTYALHVAARCGRYEIVQGLLERGANVNSQMEPLGSALQAAAAGGHKRIAELLLDTGALVNLEGGNWGTALLAASFMNHDDLVEILADAGADVNIQIGHFGNALQAASFAGNAAAVLQLLKKGADVNATGGSFHTALQAAIAYDHRDVIDLLLRYGADRAIEGRPSTYHPKALEPNLSQQFSAPIVDDTTVLGLVRSLSPVPDAPPNTPVHLTPQRVDVKRGMRPES